MAKEASVPPGRPSNSSIARKLVRAAALAAALVPLGSVPAEAASITCGFGSGDFGGEACSSQLGGEFGTSPTTSRYDFEDYYLELNFVLVSGAAFDVTVTNTDMTQEAFLEERAGDFTNYTCIELTEGGPCVEFEVVPSVPQNGNWISYELEIRWRKWDAQSYDPALMRILHDIGGTTDGFYDEDMCLTALTNTAYLPCVVDPDPAIRSGDTAFQFFTAALAEDPLIAPVPEPASLVLLGTGLVAVAYGRRRRR